MLARRRFFNFAGIALVLFLLLVVALSFALPQHKTTIITFDRQPFRAQIADTPGTRAQGLSGTDGLASNGAMLFVFEELGFWGMWMKDMSYPIDIVWINERKKVVHVEQNVSPDSYPRSYVPTVPAKYVVELRAGTTEQYSIKQGDQVSFVLP